MVSLVLEVGVGKRISLGCKVESVADVQAVSVSNMTMSTKQTVLFSMGFLHLSRSTRSFMDFQDNCP